MSLIEIIRKTTVTVSEGQIVDVDDLEAEALIRCGLGKVHRPKVPKPKKKSYPSVPQPKVEYALDASVDASETGDEHLSSSENVED